MKNHRTYSFGIEVLNMSQVLGTSLTVYPFGMLPSLAPPLTPRVLLNQEPVGIMPCAAVFCISVRLMCVLLRTVSESEYQQLPRCHVVG
jgi:hypothetical protein